MALFSHDCLLAYEALLKGSEHHFSPDFLLFIPLPDNCVYMPLPTPVCILVQSSLSSGSVLPAA